jgi:hypothetical protein
VGETDKAKRNTRSVMWIALVAILICGYFGYTLGKDRALRDNARERAAQDSAS